MKIEIDEYVRTKNGRILKVDAEIKVYFDSILRIDILNGVKSHSKNIIDLIEVGDYVNKKCVEHIYYYDNHIEVIFINDIDLYRLKEKDIKTILTHEQFEQNAYRLEEK